MWKITSALIYCSLPECICKNCAEECNRCASVCIQLSSDKLGIIRFIFRELWKRCSKGGRGALRRCEKKINIRHPSRQTFQLVQGFEMMRQFFLPRPFHIKTLHHIVYSKWAIKYWFRWKSANNLCWYEFRWYGISPEKYKCLFTDLRLVFHMVQHSLMRKIWQTLRTLQDTQFFHYIQ